MSVCAVTDTESSVVVLEIASISTVSGSQIQRHFLLGPVLDWTDAGFLILSSGDSANNAVMFDVYVQSCSVLGLDTV